MHLLRRDEAWGVEGSRTAFEDEDSFLRRPLDAEGQRQQPGGWLMEY